MKTLLLLLLLCPFLTFSQIDGKVVERGTNEPIFGAKVISSQGGGAITDVDGSFSINTTQFPDTLVTKAATFENDTLIVTGPGTIQIILAKPQELKTIVVTSGRRGQDIEDVPISMEILTPELIDNKGLTNLEDAVSQSPEYLPWTVK